MRTTDPQPERTRLQARRLAHDELLAITEALVAEFSGLVPAGTVIRHLAMAREQLLAAGVRAGLGAAAEAMARIRLAALVPARAGGG